MLRKCVSLLSLAIATALCLSPALASAAASKPNCLVVAAPASVQPGEEFTVTVTGKQDGAPVAGASVSLTERYEPLKSGSTAESGVAPSPELGSTGTTGELKVSIKDAGNYFIVAEKDSCTKGFSAIAVRQVANQFTLTVGQPTFAAGKSVSLTFRNGLSTGTTLSSAAPWSISRPNGDMTFAPMSAQVQVQLKAGETMGWTWDQKDSQGNQVKPGVYVVSIATAQGPVTARFCVTGLRTDKAKENAAPPATAAHPFSDVTGGVEWGDPHILRLYEKGIVRGKSADVFDPDGTLTRAEFLAMLLRACEVEPAQGEEAAGAFADVLPSHWSYAYVYRAREMGIITPEEYPEGFGPDVPITRLEVAVMAARALGLEEDSASRAGEDLAVRDQESVELRYRGYVASAVEWGVLRGYEDGTFRPSDNATRREACVIIFRMLGST